jgi:RNA polymerase sigma-70 factor (ECF subfamily)
MTTTQSTGETQRQFAQLFQRTYRRAYHHAYRLTGNAADAEDVTQDAYLRAWHRFDRYDASRSFEGWLFRIITNRVIDLRRRQRRRPTCSLETLAQGEEGQPLAQEFAAPDSDPEQIVLGTIREEPLQAALATLSDAHCQALLLCAVEQRSYQEIADTMHCALGTVRSRIHRGRQLLRHALESRNVPGASQRAETTSSCSLTRNSSVVTVL